MCMRMLIWTLLKCFSCQECFEIHLTETCYHDRCTVWLGISLPAGHARSLCARWDLIGCWCLWRNTFTQAQWLWHFGFWWCCWAIRASSLALKRVCAEEAGSSTPIRCSPTRSAPCSVSTTTHTYCLYWFIGLSYKYKHLFPSFRKVPSIRLYSLLI